MSERGTLWEKPRSCGPRKGPTLVHDHIAGQAALTDLNDKTLATGDEMKGGRVVAGLIATANANEIGHGRGC